MIQAIIFDCFGVVISDALERLRTEVAGRDPAAAELIHQTIYENNRGHIAPSQSNIIIARALGISVGKLRSLVAAGESKDKDLLGYIQSLRQTHRTAMLSNIARPSLERRFEPGELERYFDEVVVSGDIGYNKPEKQAFIITADRLGVAPAQCLVIDDNLDNCRGAKAAGMQAVQYASLGQLKLDLARLLN